jgi:hypothetical protein
MSFLPDEKRKPETDPSKFTFMLYGPPKIGKTTFCAGLEDTLFLDTEEGTRFQEVYTVPIENWEKFTKVVNEILKGDHKYKTIAIDTVGRLIQECIRFCTKKLGIEHPSEEKWGKAYDRIKKVFDEPINKLLHSPYGIWFVGHQEEKEITSGGASSGYTFIQPEMPNFIRKLVIPLVDFIIYADYTVKTVTEGDPPRQIRRNVPIIKTVGSRNFMAGSRLVKVRLPEIMEMDATKFTEELKKCLVQSSNNPTEEKMEINL